MDGEFQGAGGEFSPESMTFKLELRPEWNFSKWSGGMVMAMNKGVWCAQGRGLLVDLGVTGEVADRVPEGGLWVHEGEALSVVLVVGWQRATRGCGGICGDLVIESFGRSLVVVGRKDHYLARQVRVQGGGAWGPWRGGD